MNAFFGLLKTLVAAMDRLFADAPALHDLAADDLLLLDLENFQDFNNNEDEMELNNKEGAVDGNNNGDLLDINNNAPLGV
ncbi:hypothetical protein QR680_008070 [Steinernema hermaphroditum]|uniref:Uncharacterized protein n=1 Tax=Steinernema hermaphroditum TaxID=289476 RepID=A0AA39IGQ1_9BILA|nr:hypothetical protein QR680_008070 [Steinernema hermaphroditum]